MAEYAVIRDGSPVALAHGRDIIDGSGTRHPWSVVSVWTASELAGIGVYPVVTDPVSYGYHSTGSSLTWDGWTVRRVHTVELSPVDLPALKADLKRDIDRQAEAERSRYITSGSGQALTYQHKSAEAQRYIETEGAGTYPLLSAEVGITGATLADVAAVVHGAYQAWLAIGAQIEAARLSAKAAIDAAEDEAGARSVVPTWP